MLPMASNHLALTDWLLARESFGKGEASLQYEEVGFRVTASLASHMARSVAFEMRERGTDRLSVAGG